MAVLRNIVIGNPVCEPWHMFCKTPEEWEDTKTDVMFTSERFLPKLMVNAGIVKSVSEVRRNKPELVRTLDKPDFLEISWGKSKMFIQVGT